MKKRILLHDSLTIRLLETGDTRALLAFANDLIAEDTYLMLSGKKMTYATEKKYVRDSLTLVRKKRKIHLIAEVDGVIVGSAEIRRGEKRKHHIGEIGISVLKEFRQEGIGRRLMSKLIGQGKLLGLRMLMLHCFENNTVAIGLYKKFGFVVCGLLPEAYHHRDLYIGEVTLYKNLQKRGRRPV